VVFTYIGLIRLTEDGQEKLHEAPKYLEKIRTIIEEEGGLLEDVYAFMGPWDDRQVPGQRDRFRVLAKIGMLEVVKTETSPAEKVDVFVKALV
jgi:uncharacterized protein with GYD domain